MSCARRFSPRNREAFLQALDRMADEGREPTPQEAACLFCALGAMARGDERLAEQKIALLADGPSSRSPGWTAPSGLTVAGLRRALAELSDLERRPMPDRRAR